MTLGLGALATYTGWTIGKFKLRYPHVQNQADAGEIIGGPWLREAWGIAQILFCALHIIYRGPLTLSSLESSLHDSDLRMRIPRPHRHNCATDNRR